MYIEIQIDKHVYNITIMSHGSIYYTIEIWPPPLFIILLKAVSRMWTKQNVFHEIGDEIKYWCCCKCQHNIPTSIVSLKRIFFTGKKYYGITIILLMYQSAMLHKYKQNITFNVINTQIYTKNINPWRNKGWVIFHREGSIVYYSILTPG